MVNRALQYLALVFILILGEGHLLLKASAIKCYVCQSHVDPKCADPFDNLTLSITDCDGYPRQDLAFRADGEFSNREEKSSSIFPISLNVFTSLSSGPPPLQATVCRKIRQKVYGDWRTTRSCGYLTERKSSFDGPINSCVMRYGTNDIFMESCTCNGKDGCNLAGEIHKDSTLLLSFSIILSILSYYHSPLLNLQ